MRAKFYLKIIYLLILGCSPSHEKNGGYSFTSRLPGEDSLMPLLPGQGFNHVTWQPKGHCVDLTLNSTQSGRSQGYTSEFRLFEVSSISDLREGLQIGASASFQGSLFGNISSRFSFAQSIKKKNLTQDIYLST